jgi:hypothetical protein
MRNLLVKLDVAILIRMIGRNLGVDERSRLRGELKTLLRLYMRILGLR